MRKQSAQKFILQTKFIPYTPPLNPTHFENFKIEIDHKKKLSAEIKNNSLIIQATSPIHLINEMSKTKSRTTRNRIKIIKGTGNKVEKILVTVRIHDCIRGQM